MVVEYPGRTPTTKVFFCFFNVLRSQEKGSEGKRQGHVGFRCNPARSIFLPANDSNRYYKLNFFFVRALNDEAKYTIGDYEDGKLARRQFSWFWSWEHFIRNSAEIENAYYATRSHLLRGDDKESYELLNKWGMQLTGARRKFKCEEMIKAVAQSKAKLHEYLDSFMLYFSFIIC